MAGCSPPAQWTAPRPINVYVIEQPEGLVLFDTGQDRASVTDPGYFPGGANGLVYRARQVRDRPRGDADGRAGRWATTSRTCTPP